MKRMFAFILIVSLLALVGCNSTGTRDDNDNGHKEPPKSIGVRSLDQLNEMRQMVLCADENELHKYLNKIEGGGANSRDDLIDFLNLIDSLTVLDLIEGNITWISNSKDESTGTSVVYLTIQSSNEEWVRMEYMVSVENVTSEIDAMKTAGKINASEEIKNIQTPDGKIKAVAERKEAHPSGVGDTYTWTLIVDGVLTNVVYYTSAAHDVSLPEVIKDIRITDIAQIEKSELTK